MKVFVVNAGSSSVKYSLMDTDNETTLADGIVERIGLPGTCLKARAPGGRPEESQVERALPEVTSTEAALKEIARALTEGPAAVVKSLEEIDAVGHRVVHGAEDYSGSVLIDEKVKETVRDLCRLAPLHNPANLAGIEAAQSLLPARPHVAVFDTAFHSTMPPEAHLYGLPLRWARREKIRRYGFHGTSHKYVSQRTAELLGNPERLKLVTAHIGNGVSLTAVRDGMSVDTTMGFTPLEGVVMGTRSGSVDPALVLYLVEEVGMKPREVDGLLNSRSGLLGLAGIGSGDLRDVLAAREAGDEAAALAFRVYVYRIRLAIGSLAAAMRGLDALAFTAGAGENCPLLRAEVCSPLGHLGVELDVKRNEAPSSDDRMISRDTSPCKVLVVRTKEDLLIALEVVAVLRGGRRAD